MIYIAPSISIPEHEVQISAIRAQGSGGQNVNKVSSAIHLHFDIKNSSLPEHLKSRLLELADTRISKEGIVIIKAQQYRTQWQNKADAYQRLAMMIRSTLTVPKPRKLTQVKYGAKLERLKIKNQRKMIKSLRKPVSKNDY